MRTISTDLDAVVVSLSEKIEHATNTYGSFYRGERAHTGADNESDNMKLLSQHIVEWRKMREAAENMLAGLPSDFRFDGGQ